MRTNTFCQVLIVVGTVVATSDGFKLPVEVKVKENIETRKGPNSDNYDENGNGQTGTINSIPVSRRRIFKYADTDERPIAFQNENGDLKDSPIVTYEIEKPRRFERFYKQPYQSQERLAERIIFPSEEVNEESDKGKIEEDAKVGDRSNGKVSTGMLAPTNSQESITAANESGMRRREQQYVQSLESLAQIVRHLLLRMPVSDIFDVVPTMTSTFHESSEREYLTTNNGDEKDPNSSTSTSLDVREQSLYSGPKLRATPSGSDECPEGYKKTRNGSCQKPSRRLLTISR